MADKVMKLGLLFFFSSAVTKRCCLSGRTGLEIYGLLSFFFSFAPHPDVMKAGWSARLGEKVTFVFTQSTAPWLSVSTKVLVPAGESGLLPGGSWRTVTCVRPFAADAVHSEANRFFTLPFKRQRRAWKFIAKRFYGDVLRFTITLKSYCNIYYSCNILRCAWFLVPSYLVSAVKPERAAHSTFARRRKKKKKRSEKPSSSLQS